jgi:hypothetical protein
MKLVAQVTPTTCILACLESFLYDQGIFVTQYDILRCHPDLFTSSPDTFGILDVNRFIQLVGRLSWKCTELPRPSVIDIKTILGKPTEGIIVFCDEFNTQKGKRHAIRLKELDDTGNLYFMNPGYLRVWTGSVLFTQFASWQPHYLRIHEW